jgi:hypothetical protein
MGLDWNHGAMFAKRFPLPGRRLRIKDAPMMKRTCKWLIALLVLVALGGCSTTKSPVVPDSARRDVHERA